MNWYDNLDLLSNIITSFDDNFNDICITNNIYHDNLKMTSTSFFYSNKEGQRSKIPCNVNINSFQVCEYIRNYKLKQLGI